MDKLSLAAIAFIGGWLLFAGPVYQASVELRERSALHLEVSATLTELPTPRWISPWWWLIPPAAIVRQHLQSRRFKKDGLAQLSTDQRATWTRLSEKATGWGFVAVGAFLLAFYETGRLVSEAGLAAWVLWITAPLAALVCVGTVWLLMRQSTRR